MANSGISFELQTIDKKEKSKKLTSKNSSKHSQFSKRRSSGQELGRCESREHLLLPEESSKYVGRQRTPEDSTSSSTSDSQSYVSPLYASSEQKTKVNTRSIQTVFSTAFSDVTRSQKVNVVCLIGLIVLAAGVVFNIFQHYHFIVGYVFDVGTKGTTVEKTVSGQLDVHSGLVSIEEDPFLKAHRRAQETLSDRHADDEDDTSSSRDSNSEISGFPEDFDDDESGGIEVGDPLSPLGDDEGEGPVAPIRTFDPLEGAVKKVEVLDEVTRAFQEKIASVKATVAFDGIVDEVVLKDLASRKADFADDFDKRGFTCVKHAKEGFLRDMLERSKENILKPHELGGVGFSSGPWSADGGKAYFSRIDNYIFRIRDGDFLAQNISSFPESDSALHQEYMQNAATTVLRNVTPTAKYAMILDVKTRTNDPVMSVGSEARFSGFVPTVHSDFRPDMLDRLLKDVAGRFSEKISEDSEDAVKPTKILLLNSWTHVGEHFLDNNILSVNDNRESFKHTNLEIADCAANRATGFAPTYTHSASLMRDHWWYDSRMDFTKALIFLQGVYDVHGKSISTSTLFENYIFHASASIMPQTRAPGDIKKESIRSSIEVRMAVAVP